MGKQKEPFSMIRPYLGSFNLILCGFLCHPFLLACQEEAALGGPAADEGGDQSSGEPGAEGSGTAASPSQSGSDEQSQDDGSEEEGGTAGGEDGEETTPVPGDGLCCGCLCDYSNWSCSEDTCLDNEGKVVELAPEAGFIEVSGSGYYLDGHAVEAADARIWYVYQPADVSPESKPIMLFFNGGPGASTMPFLFGMNTAPYTVDPGQTGERDFTVNRHPWSEYANLLYVDAPGTGFSYFVDDEFDAYASRDYFDSDRDAAVYLHVLLHFLEHHPGLRQNEVILVGESYGGTRAQRILHQAFNYEDLQGEAFYSDDRLFSKLEEHFSSVFPELEPPFSPSDISQQFGKQVLVQPVVSGEQLNHENFPDDHCVNDYDWYQCDERGDYTFEQGIEVSQRLLDPETLSTVLAVDVESIEWMHARSRGDAVARFERLNPIDQSAFTETFGELSDNDQYFVLIAGLNFHHRAREVYGPELGRFFLENTYYGEVLITDARFDLVVPTSSIAPGLRQIRSVVESTRIVRDEDESTPRPGWIEIQYRDGYRGSSGATRRVRFPHYGRSGHTVTHRQAPELLEDLKTFFE